MFSVCYVCRRVVQRLCTGQTVGSPFFSSATRSYYVTLIQDRGIFQSRDQCHLTTFTSPSSLSKHQTGPRIKWISNSANKSHAEEKEPKRQRPIAQTTIDEEEVNKFSSLAELWWDEAGEFEALHSMNELRVPLVRDALIAQRRQESSDFNVRPSLPLQGFRILDVGSGGGILSEPLARLGAFVTGVDASEENIRIAQAHVLHEAGVARNIKYIQATVEDLVGTEAGSFDAVIASEVVEHVADVSTFVTACCQLVKPGGSIFLTTLNKTYLSYALGVVGAENFLHLVSPGTHDWNKFISPQDLQFILDQNEFSTRLLHGMMYNPLTKRWTWMKNTSVNYAIHAVKARTSPTASASSPQHS
ncbi:ubiquinone biosynthesis O-methyltransferase-like [Babylonia areolata]|uniref:ubiquinone biosynthesis O-methyltransferase-like n=1 Tax=Babylonia areolata TaxID=304850 RepID=UPI003FD1929E